MSYKIKEIENNETTSLFLNNVEIVLKTKENIKINSLSELIKLDEERPELIIDIQPPLYSLFINKQGLLNPYVKIGDEVDLLKGTKLKPFPSKVVDLKLSNLGNLSVIIAETENKDMNLSYFLKPI